MNPQNISFLTKLAKDSYAYSDLDNTFIVVKSIDGILILIYANIDKSIISYNLINNQKIAEVKRAHNFFITNFRHHLDSINLRDLIISISYKENNIKLWNIKNWYCLLNIKNIYDFGWLNSACFLKANNQTYILTSNSNFNKNDVRPIKVYDYDGNQIKEINNSKDKTYFIDAYYDNNLSKNFIITGNDGSVKSYDYNNNKLYHIYSQNPYYIFLSLIIKCNKNNTNLIESGFDGYIRIWDFHLGILLSEINISYCQLYGICLWDNNFLLASCDNLIALIDIENQKVIKCLVGHKHLVLTLKKINHPHYGPCLISQGFENDFIKIWSIKT